MYLIPVFILRVGLDVLEYPLQVLTHKFLQSVTPCAPSLTEVAGGVAEVERG